MDTTENMETDVSKNEVDNIPIFTPEFIEHNRHRESELRSLKHMVKDCEMKNASLETHISSISATIDGLDNEIQKKKGNNALVYNQLSKIRSVLYKEFKEVRVPGSGETPTQDTIERYLERLQVNYDRCDNPKEKEIIKKKVTTVLAKFEEFEN